MNASKHKIGKMDNSEKKISRVTSRVTAHCDIEEIWVYDNSFEIHIEEGGVWNSDLPEGYTIIDSKIEDGEMVVRISLD